MKFHPGYASGKDHVGSELLLFLKANTLQILEKDTRLLGQRQRTLRLTRSNHHEYPVGFISSLPPRPLEDEAEGPLHVQ